MERPYAESKQAIHVWLLENKGEEEIWARRYYQFWGEQPGRNQRYLLVVTSLKLAAEEKVRAQEEEDRQQREKLQSAQRIAGPDGIYTVMAGDTASKIARAFRLKMDQLILLNPGVDWAKLKVGQNLRVRSAVDPENSAR